MGSWFPWVVKLNNWEEDYLSDSMPMGEILQYFLFEPNRHEYFLPGQGTENLQFAVFAVQLTYFPTYKMFMVTSSKGG